jgi:hypothetical protein
MRLPQIILGAARASMPEDVVSDWRFAEKYAHEELALLTHFSVKKQQKDGEVSFLITVKEFVNIPPGQAARFVAQADKHVNQKIAPIIPTGWGNSLLDAISVRCRRNSAVRRSA